MGLYDEIISFENIEKTNIYRQLYSENNRLQKLSKVIANIGLSTDVNTNLISIYIKDNILSELITKNKNKNNLRKKIIKKGLDNCLNEQFIIIKNNIDEYYDYLSSEYKTIFEKYRYNEKNEKEEVVNLKRIEDILTNYYKNQKLTNAVEKNKDIVKILKLNEKMELAYNKEEYKNKKIMELLMSDIGDMS